MNNNTELANRIQDLANTLWLINTQNYPHAEAEKYATDMRLFDITRQEAANPQKKLAQTHNKWAKAAKQG